MSTLLVHLAGDRGCIVSVVSVVGCWFFWVAVGVVGTACLGWLGKQPGFKGLEGGGGSQGWLLGGTSCQQLHHRMLPLHGS